MKPFVKTLFLVFLISCFGFAGSHAGWIENGVPLTHQWRAAGGKVIAPDGSSGAIIAYQVCHDGVSHIVAQRVNSLGAVLWGDEGIEICAALGDQYNPTIVSDGAGGAIVMWRDSRSGTWEIYAQRVNASGSAQWTADGVALTTTTGDKQCPTITSDGAGGAIVTWNDFRSGNGDIYAQKVNASGTIQWTTDGVALCTATGDQQYPTITSDGADGAIITWQDHRSGYWDIYAQRVDASGAVQWTADGVALCTALMDQLYPIIISDGAGGAIVTWQDNRSGYWDIYAQRVNASGAVLWTMDGVFLCTGVWFEQSPAITSDGAGGAIVAWSNGADIYAQRVNASGTVQWATDGVAICPAAGDQYNPMIVSDGAGGAIVEWDDERSGNADIYAQRVDGWGYVQWSPDGVAICTATGYQQSPAITSDGAGGAILAWGDPRGGNADIYAQKINAWGAVQWTGNGVALTTSTGDQQSPQIIPDGAGGAIVTWRDFRGGDWDIYAQRVDAWGAVQWTADGVALCTALMDQLFPIITSDGAGGAIITWQDGRSGNRDIYAQRVDASGAVQWMADGVVLCTATGYQQSPKITSDGAGGAIVTWHDGRSGSGNNNIYAQKVNASGSVQWTADGVALCTATGEQTGPAIISDGAGGAVVAWADSRAGNSHIYAQKINASGAVQWTTDGVALCIATRYQHSVRIASDGAGGAVVAWTDYRSGRFDIYAQRVDASGAVQWMADGIGLCTAAYDQASPTIASDGAGGAIIAWDDDRSDNPDIYAQRVNASGSVQWTADGVALCAEAGYQTQPAITSDGAGGAVVTWRDYRSENFDIYAQKVNASGAVQWTADGIALCTATGDQQYPAIVTDDEGGVIIAWEDRRCGLLTYAQRLTASGVTNAITMPAPLATLYQNHPNPFNPQTVIRFYLPQAQEIFLDVYNVAGERVARLAEGKREKGYHEAIWNGRSSSGTVCSSGVYFCRLHAGAFTDVRKMILLK